MSSSLKKTGGNASDKVLVETIQLRERLNRLYQVRTKKSTQTASFEELWDLKELALLEGRPSIEVPRRWLDELEGALDQMARPH